MNYEELLDLTVDLAVQLQNCGAETYRVEEAVVRLLEAYDVFMKESRQELDRLFEKHFSREWVEELKKSSN